MNSIRILKLFIISVVVFGVLIFCLSLLFPSTTYVSRAVNVKAEKNILNDSMPELYTLAFHDNEDSIEVLKTSYANVKPEDFRIFDVGEFISSAYKISFRDTLIFTSPFSSDIKQAVAVYKAGNDSATVQVFYKIHVPWYKPWKKFALMLNESKYGPSLDSAISRISRKF